MKCKDKNEILAPAGNFESLRAAVINGADAVYLGASAFSARAKAGNFSNEELAKAVEYCHLYDVKVYLAINTIIKPEEYESALNTVLYGKKVGVDAFIMQDLAFIMKIRSTMPDINIHLSTQAGVHNLDGARFAEKLGVSRVILSREATLEDIKEICENTTLEVEVFIHGALCIAFSGNCYFSSMATGLSGNRGRCLQLCRKKYTSGSTTGYLLSAKDLDLTARILELKKLGVKSFKIEGRMRRPEYVGEAVRHYKAILSGKQDDSLNLKKLFNRGDGTEGYLLAPTAPVVYHKLQGHSGVKIGSVSRIVNGKAQLKTIQPLRKGDGLKFIRNGREVATSLVNSTGNTVGFLGNVKECDDVYVTTDEQLISEINSRTRRLPVEIELTASVNNPLIATAYCGDAKITILSDFFLDKAQKAPLSENDFANCFSKTGDTEFILKSIRFARLEDVFVPKGLLNDFRRRLFEQLKNELLSRYDKKNSQAGKMSDELKFSSYNEFDYKTIIQVDDLSIIANLDEDKATFDAIAFSPKRFDAKEIEEFKQIKYPKLLSLPIILRRNDVVKVKEFIEKAGVTEVIANNLAHFELAKDCKVLVGYGLNVVNPTALGAKILSFEYDGRDYGENFVYTYGKVPLMTFAHCPKKTLNGDKCINCNHEPISFSDENGNKFDIRFFKIANCYSQLLNCTPTNVINEVGKLKIKRQFIDLVGHTLDECKAILLQLSKDTALPQNKTKGYFSKKLI